MREKFRRDLSDGLGPFTREARAAILRRLLTVQKETELDLISEDELSAIQWIWHHDFHDAPIVAEIYREVTGQEVLVVRDEIVKRREEERALLKKICDEEGVPAELVEQLVQIEKDKSGLMRRHGLFQDIDMALKKYLKRNPNDASVEDSST
jgi:DNA sulfur modification protein DndC